MFELPQTMLFRLNELLLKFVSISNVSAMYICFQTPWKTLRVGVTIWKEFLKTAFQVLTARRRDELLTKE